MTTFEIKEEFMLDGEPFKILSGAIHHFRIHPEMSDKIINRPLSIDCFCFT